MLWYNTIVQLLCRGGGIGRHARLKILCPYGRAGSIPARGTTSDYINASFGGVFCTPTYREYTLTSRNRFLSRVAH